jgi:hypothetical protein
MALSHILDYLGSAGLAKVEGYQDFDCTPATAEALELFVGRT